MRSLFAAVLSAVALVGGASFSAEAFTGANSRDAVAGHGAAGARHLQLARAMVGYDGAEPTDRSATDGHLYRPRYGKPRHLRSARGTRVRTPRHAARHSRVVQRAAQRNSRSAAIAPAGAGGGMTGMASFYGGQFHGRRTASGVRFDSGAMTAAHRSLPFGTRVRVTHLGNGRSVEVRINDRGPYVGGRIIDLSRGAAGVLGMHGQGVARVKVTVVGR
jgi:peptidoglycan lytic transglycosylase